MMKSVLLVDDLVENRYLLRSILETAGWEVFECASGAEALTAAHERKPNLVISDILMPGMDGFTLCRAWKQDPELLQIPFVFCTATFTDEADEQLANELGADAFIPQPVDSDYLLSVLRSLEKQMTEGEPPHAPATDPLKERANTLYTEVLARKLDHKVTEYRNSIAELKISRAELAERVRELTCLHKLNLMARDTGIHFSVLCQESASELAAAFSTQEEVSVRLRFAGTDYCSKEFHETEHRINYAVCPECPENQIAVFVTEPATATDQTLIESRRMLVETIGNMLSAEHRRRELAETEASNALIGSRMLHLTNTIAEASEPDVIQNYLEAAVELTGSEIGYLHFVNEDQETILLVTWSKNTLKACAAVEETHYPISQAGVWAECFHTRAPAVHNDFALVENKKGLPDGHIPLARHLSVPVMDQDKITMILGVGNRIQPYGNHEVATMETIANTLWHAIDRKRRAAALMTANERLTLLQTALESTSHTVVITDTKGTIEWVNPAFTHDTGYTATEALGQNPRVLKSGRHGRRFYENLWETISSGRVWHGIFFNRRKDGTIFEEDASITPVKDSSGEIKHFIAIKQDVTKKHEMEKLLLRSQRMESIGLLAGGVAHDLNNVLAPIMMAVEMLKEDLPAEDRLQLAHTLGENCQRGAGIIRQVLTFARGAEGERVLLQPRHLVKEIVKIAKETFPKDITISMEVPANLWPTLGDATQLHQVLLNLCVNARDALSLGGLIKLSGSNEILEENRIFLSREIPPGRYVHLCVSDNGIGIEPAVLERIFEPFFTTKEVGKGTGLGLSTVLGIVSSHDGLVEVDSQPGAGTQFHVYLPASDEEVQPADTTDSAPPSGQGETILVVDDEQVVVNITSKTLQMNGYKVLKALDGAEATALYAQHRDSIAIVLTDIMMPIMDGLALARALLSINPAVIIIGSSGFSGEVGTGGRIDQLRKLGVKTILEKPYGSRELLTTVAEALADR